MRVRKTLFIKNAIVLTVTSLLVRFAGIIFKVWLGAEIGSEGIGLYQLIFSFYMLASTFATSGISTAVTRLVAEEMCVGSNATIKKIVKKAIAITLLVAFVSMLLIFILRAPISELVIGDKRAFLAVCVLPFSLPFMGVSSCFRGYFIARRKSEPNAVSQIAEQVLRILLVLTLVRRVKKFGIVAIMAAVMAGDVISEISATVILGIAYISALKRSNFTGRATPPFSIGRKISSIAVPISSGRYLNTLLRTGENLLVPKMLSRFSQSGILALSQFGMIKGMALPVLFFPSAILSSVSTLLIPEISRNIALSRPHVVRETVAKIIKITSLISFIFTGVFLVSGEKIGALLYEENEVGFLIKALAPIVPFMYLDSISDGILKGLDQQNFTFKTSVSDSVIRIILIVIFVPISGIKGFILIMYFSNFLTCFLNMKRLLSVASLKLSIWREFLTPAIIAITTTLFLRVVLEGLHIKNSLVYIMFLVVASIAIYTALLFALRIVDKETLKK